MGIPKIGITLGDPGGIGPEVAFKSLLQCEELESICPIIFGPSSLLAHGKLTPIVRQLNVIQLTDLASLDGSPNRDAAVYFLETEDLPPLGPEGKDDGANGHIAYQSIVHAAALAGEGSLDGLVTAPISKTSFKLGGIKDSGHTSLLQRLTGAHDVSMAFFTPALKVVLATIHIPLAEVPAALDEETLCRAIRNGRDFVRALGITNPRIAVAGLNPHAGEGGLFGHEESTVLA
ncbi:MAG: 4-hydroxy-L-threonine phosphate dehydrogenase PdxA, partial [Candidatus Marinamargulisbacteria bacterium]